MVGALASLGSERALGAARAGCVEAATTVALYMIPALLLYEAERYP